MATKRRRDPSSEQLPISEDWSFRIKVISSATDLHNDVFRDAVRGLVRICFPDGILEQLGQHVVEGHMRGEHANTANMQRMSEAFKSEMIHHLFGMLGGYFDTPDQVLTAVQTALKAHDNSSDGTKKGLDNAASEQSSPPKKRRRNKSLDFRNSIPVQSEDIQREDARIEMNAPVIQDVASTPDTAQHRRKDKKVSSTWAWNIDSSDFLDEVNTAFPRTADLFAYHALPIAKAKLGSKASRKELRLDMQSMLDALPQDEFAHWIHSLELLHNGDQTMLIRSMPLRTIDNLPRMTPAPGKSRPRADVGSYEQPIMKQEAIDGNVLTEIDGFPLPVFSTRATIRKQNSGTQRSDSVGSDSGMSVLRLLLGTDILTPDQCLNNSGKIAATIMENLKRRVSAEKIVKTALGSGPNIFTKTELHELILSAFSRYRKDSSIMKTARAIEVALLHWVIAKPKAFPELKAMSFVFTHALPYMTPVSDLLLGSWPAISGWCGSQIWQVILGAQKRRGISEASGTAANVNYSEIANIYNDRRRREIVRHMQLDRVLRRLAFAHRDKFPELKETALVKNWEERTGLTW